MLRVSATTIQNCVAYCPINGTYTTFLKRTHLSVLWVHLAYFRNYFQSELPVFDVSTANSTPVNELTLYHEELWPKNRLTQSVILYNPCITQYNRSSLIWVQYSSWFLTYNSERLSPGGVHIEAITSDHIFAKKPFIWQVWVSQCYQPQSKPVVLAMQCNVSPSGHYDSVLVSLKVSKGK